MKTITTNKILLASLILLLNSAAARADNAGSTRVGEDTLFPCSERQLDLYGTVRDNGHVGIGGGFNYFFTDWLGAGVETRWEKLDWPNQLNASIFARYPLEQWRLAPYLFGGGGRQFRDGTQWLGHIGGGVDYRLWNKAGLFGDVRGTFPEKSSNFALFRFGLRLCF